MKKRLIGVQIIEFVRGDKVGLPNQDLCRRHGFPEASYYLWRSKFRCVSVSIAQSPEELDTEYTCLKKPGEGARSSQLVHHLFSHVSSAPIPPPFPQGGRERVAL